MELLLKKTIDKVGELGEIVDVSPGYARNYLIPKGYAEPLSPAALRRVEQLKKKMAEEEALKTRQEKQMLKDIQARESFTIMAEADETGQLYGSVTETMIADLLRDEGFDVDKKHILIEEPIKNCDIFSITVKIGEETGQFKLWVVAK